MRIVTEKINLLLYKKQSYNFIEPRDKYVKEMNFRILKR